MTEPVERDGREGARRGVARVAVLVVVAGVLACGGGGDGPRVIAKLEEGTTVVGAAEGRVFWVGRGVLHWHDRADGALAIDDGGWASRDNVLVDGNGVYIAHHNKLDHVGVDGVGWRREAGEHPAGVVRQGDCVYVVDVAVECNGRGALIGWPIVKGASCPRFDVPANGLQPIELAADERYFYWADGGCAARVAAGPSLNSLDRTTGAVAAVAEGEPMVGQLQAGTRGVYWRAASNIRRAAPGAAVSTVVSGAIDTFVVDRGVLFYAREDGVYAMAEDGGRERRLAAVAGARELAVDARFVYWKTAARELVRVARTGP